MKEFTFTLNEQDIQVISEALGDVAFKKSAPLVQKLQNQINDQLKSTDTANIGTN